MRVVWLALLVVLAGCSEPEPEREPEEDCTYGPCDLDIDIGWWVILAPILGIALLLVVTGLVVYSLLKQQRPPEQP